jgi:serine/threonine-protein kinase
MTPALLNNRYRIIRALGAGGFGETFLAEDTQMPSGRRCVLKQLKPVSNNPQIQQMVKERFQREAAILERLGEAHPQIPRLYAYFEVEGQFYLVQEWVEGETLTLRVQERGRLPEAEVRDILISLLPVLDYVHSQRMVHRDIKPDNIILRTASQSSPYPLVGKGEVPVLIDFGAVKETMGTVVTSGGNATQSIVIGTPGFMPSEQSAGRPMYCSDLYSLGLTAVYLLTGKLPPQLEVDSFNGDILWRHHVPNLDPHFVAVLDKSIQGHPRDRYSTAGEMLAALNSAGMAGVETVASTVPPTVVMPSPSSNLPPTIANPVQPSQPSPPSQPTQTLPTTQTPVVSQGSGNGSKMILLASAIAGGLIGGSILMGLMLTRSPQPQFQQSIESPLPADSLATNPQSEPSRPIVNPAPPESTESAQSSNTMRQVRFANGETGATLRAYAAPNQTQRYLINSGKGQWFTAQVEQGNVDVAVIAPNGQILGTASPQWEGSLPSSGDYVVEVSSAKGSDYAVRVDVVSENPSAPSTSRLDQVLPSYMEAALPAENVMISCPDSSAVYLFGETTNFNFAVCGENNNPRYYIGRGKKTGNSITVPWKGDGFYNGDYLYDVPDFRASDFSNNDELRVYQGDRLLTNEQIVQLYRRP